MHSAWSVHDGTTVKSVIPYGFFDVCGFLQTGVAKRATRRAWIAMLEKCLFYGLFPQASARGSSIEGGCHFGP